MLTSLSHLAQSFDGICEDGDGSPVPQLRKGPLPAASANPQQQHTKGIDVQPATIASGVSGSFDGICEDGFEEANLSPSQAIRKRRERPPLVYDTDPAAPATAAAAGGAGGAGGGGAGAEGEAGEGKAGEKGTPSFATFDADGSGDLGMLP